MRLNPHLKRFVAGIAACAFFLLSLPACWSQTESPAMPLDPLVEELWLEWLAQQAAFDELQRQQAATLDAIELSRAQTAAALSRNADVTLTRLGAMHEALMDQSEHDREFIRSSNRRVLAIVSGLMGLLFLGMLVVMLVSTRAMNRLTVALSSLPLAQSSLNAPPAAGLLTESGAAQLQSAIERLEQRIAGLENYSPNQPPCESGETKDHSTELLSEPQAAHR